MTALDALINSGWYIKLVSDLDSRPEPCWRVWLSWRKGKMPHKEESTRVNSLEEAETWFTETAQQWDFTED